MIKRPLMAAAVIFTCARLFTAAVYINCKGPPPSSASYHVSGGLFACVDGTVYKKEGKKDGQALYLKDCEILIGDKICNESKVLVRIGTNSHISIGNRISASGKAGKFPGARNPGNFDQRAYYKRQGIYMSVRAKHFAVIGKKVWPVRETLSNIRTALKEKALAAAGEEYGGIICAIILGDKSHLSYEAKDLYRKSGIGHILAISGLHMSFLGLGFYKLLRKSGLSFALAGTLGMLFLSGYAVMTGASVSALRALIMFCVKMGAEITGRQYDLLTSLSVAAAALTAGRPLYLFDAGFLLSFGSILGIAVLYPCLKYIFLRDKDKNKILNMLICSLSVNLTILPIILYFYFEIPPYSVLLNLPVIPLMSAVMALGAFGLILCFVLPFAGRSLLFICKVILIFYEKSCRFTLKLPFGRIVAGKPAFAGIVIYYVIISAFCSVVFYAKGRGRKLYRGRIAPVFAAFLILVISASCVLPYQAKGELTVTMLDVGQGDGIFLKGPKGRTYFVDGGSSDISNVGSGRIDPFLRSVGISTLDYVLISHGDDDHRNGIEELLANQKTGVRIKNLLLPQREVWDDAFEKLALSARSFGTKVLFFECGDILTEGDFSFLCLGPPDDYSGQKGNEASMTALAKYGRFRMLFTGDIGEKAERELAGLGELTGVHVLKVAHHGSKNSTSEEFLKHTKPAIALISSGIDNRHGHPHAKTLKRLDEAGCKVYRTQMSGAVTVRTDGKTMKIETFLPENE